MASCPLSTHITGSFAKAQVQLQDLNPTIVYAFFTDLFSFGFKTS